MITAVEPQASASGRYSISEACEMLGIHRNTLSKYTDAGEIRCGFRKNGRKFYLGREIMRLWRAQL